MRSMAEQLQTYILNGIKSIATILKIIIRSKYFINLPRTSEEELVIMGNGPSLKEILGSDVENLQNKTLWAVNFFGNSPFFEKVKPSYYLMVGPEFWRQNVQPNYISLRETLFENIINKTQWPMTIFLPPEAFKSKFLKKYLHKNSALSFKAFNPTPVEGVQWFNHLLFKRNLGMPRPHNVIIPSIMVALNMGFKKIFLIGVEHSWLPTISVNDNNEVLFRNKHFYDPDKIKDHRMYRLGLRPRMLHDVLEKFMLTFRGYVLMAEYAAVKKAKIFNCTPGSFIDAFERKKIEELLNP